MNRRFATLTALAAAATGACTTTHQVRRPANVAELESMLPRQRDRVTLLEEPPPTAGPSLGPPPLTVGPVERPLSREEGAPLADVSQLRGYEVKNRGRGALEGLGVGILVGAVVGMAIGVAS